MSFSDTGPALCVCALLSLPGCSDNSTSELSDATSSAPTSQSRATGSQPELDLANPMGHSDDAAMLRSTPDYSISGLGTGSVDHLGVDSGTSSDPLLASPTDLHVKPLDVGQSSVDINLGTGPPDLADRADNLKPY